MKLASYQEPRCMTVLRSLATTRRTESLRARIVSICFFFRAKTVLNSIFVVVSEYLQGKLSNSLRSYVSSKMPIRLLAFDSTGSGTRLLERRGVFQLLQPKVLAAAGQPEFQDIWNETYTIPMSRGFVDPAKYQLMQETADSVVNQLVERHATYSILSHTWIQDSPGDVIFQDWARREENPRGNAKIVNFCKVSAEEHDLDLGWMDTVCINKESSTELDESIRSMYKWYRNANVCIAYLSGTEDVVSVSTDSWFTRGWTLQELLAPRDIQFYNKSWKNMHSESEGAGNEGSDTVTAASVESSIRDATTITEQEMVLFRSGKTEAVPISRRFQLAAGRQVTREEDSAYSLMGLLGVDIAIAYGEGSDRAFSRLVRELLNTKKNVFEIFNHSYSGKYNRIIPTNVGQYSQRSPVFNVLPDSTTGDTIVSLLDRWSPTPPLLLTHVGLRMHLLLVPGLLCDMSVDSVSFVSEDVFSRYTYARNIAKGRFYGHYTLYDLLHRDLYSEKIPDRAIISVNGLPPVITFGVLNFGMDDKHIVLPENCLSVPLDCGASKPGHVRPSDRVKVHLPLALQRHPVPVFQLHSTTKGENVIPEHDLGRHGLQLLTFYL